MKLTEISKDVICVIRWRDILWAMETDISGDDAEHLTPIFETVGKIAHVKRGLVVIKVEWGILQDYENYEGEAGKSTQIIPAGCIISVTELKPGKKLYDTSNKKKVKKDDGIRGVPISDHAGDSKTD